MQGVSINIFVKTGKKNKDELGKVFHFDLFGKREEKYGLLHNNCISSITWRKLEVNAPNQFFINKNFDGYSEYQKGFKVDEVYISNNADLATEFDEFSIRNSKKEAEELLYDLQHKSASEIISKYSLPIKKIKKVINAVDDIRKNKHIITTIDYRPFDHKYTIYTGVSNGFMGRPRNVIMRHLLTDNLALLTCRQQTTFDFQHVFISNTISERCSVSLQTGEVNYIFPLYLYPETSDQQSIEQTPTRTPNLNPEIIKKIASGLYLDFTPEKEESVEGEVCFANSSETRPEFRQTFAPIDLLDYIYAVLYSPTYREKYKEFLKIDFPRVPYPTDAATFWKLVELGGELRQIHLLESERVEKLITSYPIEGSNTVDKPKYKNGKVFINATQYFDGVPETSWEFYIGGYQPAQKWLKDRRGRQLSFEDILHYQKIIVALTETEKLMQQVDEVGIEW